MTRRTKNPTKSDRKREFSIQRRTLYNQQIWLEEYIKYWTVAAACRATGISRDTYYEWVKKYSDFVKQLEEQKEERIEFVESKLYQEIHAGNLRAVMFFLRTRGGEKWCGGYEHHIEGEIKSNFQLTDEQYERLAKRIAKSSS